MDTPIQENQQEFFPGFVKPSERKLEPRVPSAGRTQKPILLTTTIEQILFTAIVTILVLCTVYFLGILRGKSLAGGRPALLAVAVPRPIQIPGPVSQAPTPVVGVGRPAARPTVSVTPSPAAAAGTSSIPATSRSTQTAWRAPVSGQKLYTIQVVTHKKRSFAEGELAAITKAGFGGKIIESDGYFVVCVGQYRAKDDAKKDLSFLKSKYPDCFLRRL